MILDAARVDAATPLVPAGDSAMSQTREHILFVQQPVRTLGEQA
jgi:translation elongation factor EF-Tu-like GTPase